MIDSVSFWVPGGKAPDLDRVTKYRDDCFRGMLGNLRIKQEPDGVFCAGSLATYLKGENVLPLIRRSLGDALGKLETATGWDLRRADLRVLEIGATVPVKYPPWFYLGSWGPVPRFKKWTACGKELETVMYSTGDRSFLGYDKQIQAKSKKMEIPKVFSGAELIRLELKYKRGLKQRLGRSLTPWDLADRETYTDLISRWQDFYFKIPKGRTMRLDTTGGISPKDLDNALKGYGLQVLGYDTYAGFITDLEKRGTLGRVQAERARKAARELPQDARISEADGLTQELDARVREIALCAR